MDERDVMDPFALCMIMILENNNPNCALVFAIVSGMKIKID